MSVDSSTSTSSKKGNIKPHQDFEYISNDPQENADNFDPKWARLRELTTDEERYKAIRERWGNSDIPDPTINLTHRHKNKNVENESKPPETETKPAEVGQGKKRQSRSREITRPPRRSRSCTRSYEQFISNLERNYQAEYSQLMTKQKAELQEMLQIQCFQTLGLQTILPQYGLEIRQNLQMQQRQDVFNLISNHYEQMRNFIGKKMVDIDYCKGPMEEIKAFFIFYQKINDREATLQMTNEQYQHTVETEKMYSLYSKFYVG